MGTVSYRNLRILPRQFEAFHIVKNILSERIGRELSNSEALAILLWTAKVALDINDPLITETALPLQLSISYKLEKYLDLAGLKDDPRALRCSIRGLLEAADIILDRLNGFEAYKRVFEILWNAAKNARETGRGDSTIVIPVAERIAKKISQANLSPGKTVKLIDLILDLIRSMGDDVDKESLITIALEGMGSIIPEDRLAKEVSAYYLFYHGYGSCWWLGSKGSPSPVKLICNFQNKRKFIQKIIKKLKVNPWAVLNFLGHVLSTGEDCQDIALNHCKTLTTINYLEEGSIPVDIMEMYYWLSSLGQCSGFYYLKEVFQDALEKFKYIVESKVKNQSNPLLHPEILREFLQLSLCGTYRGLTSFYEIKDTLKNFNFILKILNIDQITIETIHKFLEILGKGLREQLPRRDTASAIIQLAENSGYRINNLYMSLNEPMFHSDKLNIIIEIIDNNINITVDDTLSTMPCPIIYLPTNPENMKIQIQLSIPKREAQKLTKIIDIMRPSNITYKNERKKTLRELVVEILFNASKDIENSQLFNNLVGYLRSSNTPDELISKIKKIIEILDDKCHLQIAMWSFQRLRYSSPKECKESLHRACLLFEIALESILEKAIREANSKMLAQALQLAPRLVCYRDNETLIEWASQRVLMNNEIDVIRLARIIKLYKEAGIGAISAVKSPSLYLLLLVAKCLDDVRRRLSCDNFEIILFNIRKLVDQGRRDVACLAGRILGIAAGMGFGPKIL